MTVNVFAMTDTWNDSGTVFTGIGMNATNTASADGSLLIDLQVGGASKFSVDKVGLAYAAGFLKSDSGIYVLFGGTAVFYSSNFATIVGNGCYWGIASGNAFSGADAALYLDAANILAQRHPTSPTNAQAFRVYNTFASTPSTNFERGGFDWITTANVFRIRSEANGTGTNRIIAIDGFAKAGAAVAADIPSGTWALVRDTSGSTTKLIYNNAGTLMTVALT